MQNSVIHLIRYAKAQDCVISVHDGEEWAVKKSQNEKEILEAVNSVDEATIKIRRKGDDNLALGTAFIVNGLDPDELVADHSANAWFDAWSKSYQEACHAN